MPDKDETYEPDNGDMKIADYRDFPEVPPGPPGMGPKDTITPLEDLPRDSLINPEIPPEPIPEENISSAMEADVVIVGARIAGLYAACAAFEGGASVIVVEKAKSYQYRTSSVPVTRAI